MTRPRKPTVFLARTPTSPPGPVGGGEWVERDGESFYKIANYHTMPPFLMSVVSASDHWLFVSSSGGLTCGRRDPEHALFPYCTDDKIHDAWATTGPQTALLAEQGDGLVLWQPFQPGPNVYRIERNLYKNATGNKLVFEEINHDLDLVFSYRWTTGNRFGFIRDSQLANAGAGEMRVRLLDGLRNLMPFGVDRALQSEYSTLVDAYKQAEAPSAIAAALFTLSSIPTDRAEPSEALGATVVWSTGLDPVRLLLSEEQVQAFCRGVNVRPESFVEGRRGAFFVHAEVALDAGNDLRWQILADVDQGPAAVAGLLSALRRGEPSRDEIVRDVETGTERLTRLAGSADACQRSADKMLDARHFSNTLFNIMRGGVFPHEYRIPREDFLRFVGVRNHSLLPTVSASLATVEDPLTRETVLGLAEQSGDPSFVRLVYEYLPLAFGRRHGDPSRPWNRFSIKSTRPDGSQQLFYEGNWRDIFQNWDALARSFPEYVESFVTAFLNASTIDGFNPYRVSREGFDWEILDPEDPWSNIGYWGDHQVAYLVRLLELSRDYHPRWLVDSLARELFVFADVPYRIKPYRELLRDPRRTVEYDDDRAREIDRRVAAIGSDGKLIARPDGTIYRVNLLEKLMITTLARIANLVPAGGIWMNTQRPEWNDANNALVGHGLSMVTLCHLRRYLCVCSELLNGAGSTSYDLSQEVAGWLRDTLRILTDHSSLLEGSVDPAARRSFMDRMGQAVDRYRSRVYQAISGVKKTIGAPELEQFLRTALAFVDHSIGLGRRADGLFDSYSLVRFDGDGYGVEPLDEMLEGQVAVLSSGYLEPEAALLLLEKLKTSRLFREDRNSYLLYPDRQLPSFVEKNRVPRSAAELSAGRSRYFERDVDGELHFDKRFRNVRELADALTADSAVDAADADRLCELYESVFSHHRFTGRSGAMYKYEGLGCVYWHMVSKLLLATGEVIVAAVDGGADTRLVDRLADRFREIQAGIGVHEPPARYGAFPIDPYSHTPGFAGVQQPGLTGQVKEDVITRMLQLGVRVTAGQIRFEPALLGLEEFLGEPVDWSYSVGGDARCEELPAGSLAFTVCGVPVIYRLSDEARVLVYRDRQPAQPVDGSTLSMRDSRSLFDRDQRIRKLVVDIPNKRLRR